MRGPGPRRCPPGARVVGLQVRTSAPLRRGHAPPQRRPVRWGRRLRPGGGGGCPRRAGRAAGAAAGTPCLRARPFACARRRGGGPRVRLVAGCRGSTSTGRHACRPGRGGTHGPDHGSVTARPAGRVPGRRPGRPVLGRGAVSGCPGRVPSRVARVASDLAPTASSHQGATRPSASSRGGSSSASERSDAPRTDVAVSERACPPTVVRRARRTATAAGTTFTVAPHAQHLEVEQHLAHGELRALVGRPAELAGEHEARPRQRRLHRLGRARRAPSDRPLIRLTCPSRNSTSPAGRRCTCSTVSAGSTSACCTISTLVELLVLARGAVHALHVGAARAAAARPSPAPSPVLAGARAVARHERPGACSAGARQQVARR